MMNDTISIQERLCSAFCGELVVRKIPIGYAVGTSFQGMNDDPVGFYIQGPDKKGNYRIMDDALMIPTLESLGAELSSNATRKQAFESLLEMHNVIFDERTGELLTDYVNDSELPGRAIKFLSFMLRVQDLAFMSQDRATSTFKEDAKRRIEQAVQGRAEVISENFIVDSRLSEWPADMGIIAANRPPVAIFLSQTDSHVFEALLLQAYAAQENIPVSVVALLERANSISSKTLARANNHLDTVPIFSGSEIEAVNRIQKEAFGGFGLVH